MIIPNYYDTKNSGKKDPFLPTPEELSNTIQNDPGARKSLTDPAFRSVPLDEKLQIMAEAQKWNRKNAWMERKIDEGNAMVKTAGVVWGFAIGAATAFFGALHGVPEAMLAVPALSAAGYKLNSWVTRRHRPPTLDEAGHAAMRRIRLREKDMRLHPEKYFGQASEADTERLRQKGDMILERYRELRDGAN